MHKQVSIFDQVGQASTRRGCIFVLHRRSARQETYVYYEHILVGYCEQCARRHIERKLVADASPVFTVR